MKDEIQERLLAAAYSCMRPLARIFLRSGITYKQFAEAAKRAFVHESSSETDDRGRQMNASRIAVRTGLSRKEIRRLLEPALVVKGSAAATSMDHSGPPAKVLHAWHTDRRFQTPDGKPLELDFDEGEPSFCDVVKAVAGDVPPGAVRAELKRAGAIIDLDNGKLRAVKRYFVPGDFDEKAITVISGVLFPLAAAVDHNSDPNRKSGGFIQRFAFSDRLDDSKTAIFRDWARAQATEFIESVDDWFAANHAPVVQEKSPETKKVAGIGVFYYEGPSAEMIARKFRSPEED